MSTGILLAGERAQGRATTKQVLLPDHLVQGARPHPHGQRTAGPGTWRPHPGAGTVVVRCCTEEIVHALHVTVGT